MAARVWLRPAGHMAFAVRKGELSVQGCCAPYNWGTCLWDWYNPRPGRASFLGCSGNILTDLSRFTLPVKLTKCKQQVPMI